MPVLNYASKNPASEANEENAIASQRIAEETSRTDTNTYISQRPDATAKAKASSAATNYK